MYNNYTAQQQYQTYHVIIPKNNYNGDLILGDFNSAIDEQMLTNKSVKTIITAAIGFEHLVIPKSISHIVFPISDIKTQNIKTYFEQSYKIIDSGLKKGGVLVHCGAGVSRSATLIIAYYMKKYKTNFKESISYVRNIRHGICPNLGFQLQLKEYQTQIMNENDKSIILHINDKQKNGIMIMNNKKSINSQQSQNGKEINPQKTSFKQINFEPQIRNKTAMKPEKKILQKSYNKPKAKIENNKNTFNLYQIKSPGLFVSGKSAYRSTHSSNNESNSNTTRVNPIQQSSFVSQFNNHNKMLGTWGPKKHLSRFDS